MQAAFDYAVEYIHDRKQFGVPVGTFQLMQGRYSYYFFLFDANEKTGKIAGRLILRRISKTNVTRHVHQTLQ
jgi:alkylation response protein AidB-like acyl-CoA dehydrogenase